MLNNLEANPNKCSHCDWQGSLDLCDENDWGELTCPECGEAIQFHEEDFKKP